MRIHRWLPAVLVVILAVALPLLLGACGGTEPTPTPTATATPTPEDPIAAGQALYLAKGCAGCHGQEAAGTAFAPALPGHTVEQLRRQVRNPVGNMPAFTEAQMSDAELDQIAAYIASLEGGMAHVEPLEMEDLVAMHHWAAISALKADNVSDAEHHVRHIIELVTDRDHQHEMEEALQMLQAGDLHGAEHPIEEMLAGTADPGLSPMQLHLSLALAATGARDPEDAVHHMDHFMREATGADLVKGQEVIDLLKAEEYHEAGEEMESLMGMEAGGH